MPSRIGHYSKISAIFLGSLIIAYFSSSALAGEKIPALPIAQVEPQVPRMPADTRERLARASEPPTITIRDSFADPFLSREPVATNLKKGHPGLSETPVQLAPPDLGTRYEAWQIQVKRAQSVGSPVPLITTVYLHTEIEPVGLVRGGSNPGVEALVYCKPEARVFAAKVGTRFFDAKLEKVTPEGIVFETAGGSVFVEWSQEKETATPQPGRKAKPSLVGAENVTTGNSNEVAPKAEQTGEAIKEEAENTTVTAVSQQMLEATQSAESVANIEQVSFAPPTRRLRLFGPESYGPAVIAARKSLIKPPGLKGPFGKFDSTEMMALKAAHEPMLLLPRASTESWYRSPAKAAKQDQANGPKENTAAENSKVGSAATPAAKKPATGTFCDPNFNGESYNLATTRKLQLIELFEDLYDRYRVNFIIDPEIQNLPVRLSIASAPWTTIVRALLDVHDLEATCLDGGLVKIASRAKVAKQEEERRKTAPLVREVFKLRYIQPVTGGRLNLAGQTQGGPSGSLQTLEETVRGILRAGGDQRGDVRRVPGRSELIVAGTPEQIEEIRELIKRVDRPSYQVLVQALVYTVNESKLRDVGSQASLIVGNAAGTNLGGVTTLPNASSSGNGQGGSGRAGLNPGGIGGFGSGFTQPTNGLQATSPLGVLGATTIVGTAQFSLQVSLAEKKGIANIQARPFGTVTDGSTIDLVAGSQIPVVTTAIGGGAVVQTGNVQFLEASRVLRITPQVAEDEQGNPTFVTLQVQLENNAVDTSLPAFGGLPALARQSLQTTIRLADGQTGLIGGLAADSVSKATSKVPGFGEVPVVGHLFKRTTDQVDRNKLYFAITARVIPMDAPLSGAEMPSDGMTSLPAPPPPQKSIK